MFDALDWQPAHTKAEAGHGLDSEIVERRRCTLQFANGFLYLDAIVPSQAAIFGHDAVCEPDGEPASNEALAGILSEFDSRYRCVQLTNSYETAAQWASIAARGIAAQGDIAVLNADAAEPAAYPKLAITDENKSLGRHGCWLASSRWPSEPAFILFGESLAGGPFGAVLVRQDLIERLETTGLTGLSAPSASTIRTVIASIRAIERQHLIAEGERLAAYLSNRLQSVKASCVEIKSVTARGLSATVQFHKPEMARQVKRSLCERGVLAGVDRYQRLCFSLALAVRPAEIDVVAGTLRATLLKQPTWRNSPCCAMCELDEAQVEPAQL